MAEEQQDAWRRQSAPRAVRITAGIAKVSEDWRSYLALVIAAPDEATLVRWTCERFHVDEELTAALLDAAGKDADPAEKVSTPTASVVRPQADPDSTTAPVATGAGTRR